MPKITTLRSAAALALLLSPAALVSQGRATVPRGDATRTVVTQAGYDSTLLGEFAWRPIGPAITSGRIVDLAIPEGPADRISRPGQIMYAASASGGVWRTVNEGRRGNRFLISTEAARSVT